MLWFLKEAYINNGMKLLKFVKAAGFMNTAILNLKIV